MRERDALSQQTERRRSERVRLRVTELLMRQINLIAADRPAKLPEVDSDLVRAAGDGDDLEQRSAVGEAFEDREVRARGEAGVFVDVARAEFSGRRR